MGPESNRASAHRHAVRDQIPPSTIAALLQLAGRLDSAHSGNPDGPGEPGGTGPRPAGATELPAGATEPPAGATEPPAGATEPPAGATEPRPTRATQLATPA
jgi:hypothetical protein